MVVDDGAGASRFGPRPMTMIDSASSLPVAGKLFAC